MAIHAAISEIAAAKINGISGEVNETGSKQDEISEVGIENQSFGDEETSYTTADAKDRDEGEGSHAMQKTLLYDN